MPSLRILIVEDQREVSRLLRSALETLQQDIKIIECPSGEEALLEAFSGSIDLLVADYFLPGMNGIELMEKIRRSSRKVKIILITGLADPGVRRLVSEAGGDAFFIKPVPMADFLDSVERLLGLVPGGLPPEPVKTEPEKGFQQKLPDLMAKLRQDLVAEAVYFINETGRVLGRAGDIPEFDDEERLLSLLPSLHSAGLKVARLLGQDQPTSMHIVRGGKFDLVTLPVTQMYSLLVLGKGLAGEDVRAGNAEIINAASRKIIELLGEKKPELAAIEEPRTTPREAILSARQEMEPILQEAEKKIQSTNVDEFWNKAAESHKVSADSDRLTYDQAKKLGLAPEKK